MTTPTILGKLFEQEWLDGDVTKTLLVCMNELLSSGGPSATPQFAGACLDILVRRYVTEMFDPRHGLKKFGATVTKRLCDDISKIREVFAKCAADASSAPRRHSLLQTRLRTSSSTGCLCWSISWAC